LKKLTAILLALVLVLFLSAGVATASAVLKLTDGTITAEVSESDGDGVVNFTGPIGIFIVNVTTGLTKPLLGSAEWPYLDLNSVDVSSAGAGILTIMWTDTGFTNASAIGAFESRIGGTTDGTISFQAYLDASNTEFGMTTQLSDLGPFTDGAFSDESLWSGSFSEPYSITLVATIIHDGAVQVTSFDASVKAVFQRPYCSLVRVCLDWSASGVKCVKIHGNVRKMHNLKINKKEEKRK